MVAVWVVGYGDPAAFAAPHRFHLRVQLVLDAPHVGLRVRTVCGQDAKGRAWNEGGKGSCFGRADSHGRDAIRQCLFRGLGRCI